MFYSRLNQKSSHVIRNFAQISFEGFSRKYKKFFMRVCVVDQIGLNSGM